MLKKFLTVFTTQVFNYIVTEVFTHNFLGEDKNPSSISNIRSKNENIELNSAFIFENNVCFIFYLYAFKVLIGKAYFNM